MNSGMNIQLFDGTIVDRFDLFTSMMNPKRVFTGRIENGRPLFENRTGIDLLSAMEEKAEAVTRLAVARMKNSARR